MSVKHYKNGRLDMIAGPSSCNQFTGTRAEVMQAIDEGVIKEGYIVYITDDNITSPDLLNTYEEIMANTDEVKAAGALGVKEGFTQLEELETKVSNVKEFKVIEYTYPQTGYSHIPYPTGYNKDNCFIVSHSFYNNVTVMWSYNENGDQGICRLVENGIEVYKVNDQWTKIKVVLCK